ncbi:carboxymuconolactone decarboxylase family protein [Oerskovia flava]|uniref:carboxymuconolactone decarboxylase family protein n=1 Tax=Oerskovia flava TaxID=2986422 RepID=UPI00223FDF9A|nr:carboxymuconolactone decarboxylase family protein [Oerskovia sp. JB1-3-2]
MARISLDPPRTILNRVLATYSRRRYGDVLEPLRAVGHHAAVTRTYALTELGVGRWKALDPGLTSLAVMASAVAIGCSWCVDFGYWESEHQDTDPAKLHDVPRWREAGAYSPRERLVLEYAEAMTATPPTVTDELADALRDDLGDAAFVELTAIVAQENYRSRVNAALGLTSQGFSDRCEIPPAGSLAGRGTGSTGGDGQENLQG